MADDEQNSIGGRLRRYARVGAAVGGLGLRAGAGRLFGVEVDREKHAGELRTVLGGLKGPLMKVAQLLSTIPDALPDEYVKELIHLQSNAPAMGWPFVRRRMAAELGPDWEKKFAAFERDAAAAASPAHVLLNPRRLTQQPAVSLERIVVALEIEHRGRGEEPGACEQRRGRGNR